MDEEPYPNSHTLLQSQLDLGFELDMGLGHIIAFLGTSKDLWGLLGCLEYCSTKT